METSPPIAPSPALSSLETFLVEWKRAWGFCSFWATLSLETFLVEWKLDAFTSGGFGDAGLETFLVEWKRGAIAAVTKSALDP